MTTKRQPANILSILITVLSFTCFAEEPAFEQSTVDTALTPSALLNFNQSYFLSGCDYPEQPSNVSVQATHMLLMTNVVNSIVQSKQLDRGDVDAGILMISRLLECQAIKVDKNAVVYLLDSLSAIQPSSTNEYARELKAATEADMEFQRERRRRPGFISIVNRYRGPNTTALEKKWSPIFDHNRNCAELHTRLVDTFALTIPTICKILDDKDAKSLCDAIEKTEGLSKSEKKYILNKSMPAAKVFE